MDDRAYTAALASHALMIERRKNITERKRPKVDIDNMGQMFQFNQARKVTRY